MAGTSFTTAFRCRDRFQCTVENGKWKIKRISLFSTFHFPFSIMLLAVDIGNSSVKFGIFDGEHLLSKFSIPTKRDSTANELKQAIQSNLDLPITAAIICSVVPELNGPLTEFLSDAFGIEPGVPGRLDREHGVDHVLGVAEA